MTSSPRVRSLLAGLLPAALGVACDQGTGGTSDVGLSDYDPDIVVDPSTLDFGWVEPDQTKTDAFIVTNSGQGTLKIDSLTFSEGAEEAYALHDVTEDELPLIVEPDHGAIEVAVDFAPPLGAFGPAVLTLTSNDPDTPTLEITLKGNIGIPYSSIVGQSAATVAHVWYIAGDHGKTGFDAEFSDTRVLDWDGGAVAKLNSDANLDIALSFPGTPRSYTLYTRTNAGGYLQAEFDPGADVRFRFAADVDLDGVLDLVASASSPVYEGGSNPDTAVYWMRNTTAQGASDIALDPAAPLFDLADVAPPGSRVLWPTSMRDLDATGTTSTGRKPDFLFAVLPEGQEVTELWWFHNDGGGEFDPPEQVGTLPAQASFVEQIDWLPDPAIDLMWSTVDDPGAIWLSEGRNDGTFDLASVTEVTDLADTVEGPDAGWPSTLWTGATRFGDEQSLEDLAIATPNGAGNWDLTLLITDNLGGGEVWPVSDALTAGSILVPDDHPRP